jgi:hypothetical protein
LDFRIADSAEHYNALLHGARSPVRALGLVDQSFRAKTLDRGDTGTESGAGEEIDLRIAKN